MKKILSILCVISCLVQSMQASVEFYLKQEIVDDKLNLLVVTRTIFIDDSYEKAYLTTETEFQGARVSGYEVLEKKNYLITKPEFVKKEISNIKSLAVGFKNSKVEETPMLESPGGLFRIHGTRAWTVPPEIDDESFFDFLFDSAFELEAFKSSVKWFDQFVKAMEESLTLDSSSEEKWFVPSDSSKAEVVDIADLLLEPLNYHRKRVKVKGVFYTPVGGEMFIAPETPVSIPDYFKSRGFVLPDRVLFIGWTKTNKNYIRYIDEKKYWKYGKEPVEFVGTIYAKGSLEKGFTVKLRRVSSIEK